MQERGFSDCLDSKVEIHFDRMQEAILVMREVAAWGRSKGYLVWPDEWLTAEELLTQDAQPENFCIGTIDGETACAFILQWADSQYWPDAPAGEAAYLHNFMRLPQFCRTGHDRDGGDRNPKRMPQSWHPLYSPGHRAG